jgi:hypothetical protein
VLAGLLQLVRNKKGATKDVGIPGRITIEVLAPGAAEAPTECRWVRPGFAHAGKAHKYKVSGCASCGACLRALGFKCGGTLRVRVQAKGRGSALLASEWSKELEWKPTCAGPAGRECFA